MNPIENTGIILRRSDGAFLGSCFVFRYPERFLTATHCVNANAAEELVILLPVSGKQFDVSGIQKHPEADIAALRVAGIHEDDISWPHYGLFDDRAWGQDYMTFGYPQSVDGTLASPTPRVFQGHIQRFFQHTSHLGYKYLAAELSAGAPRGLSGAPVFNSQHKGRLYGVVAENVRTTTELETVLEVQDGGTTYKEISQNLINYGVAVWLPAIQDWVDRVIPPVPEEEISRRGANQQKWRESLPRPGGTV